MPPTKRRIWIRRLSIASVVLLIGLECFALTSGQFRVIRSAATSGTAIHVSIVRIGVMHVEDPSGQLMPFLGRDKPWSAVGVIQRQREESNIWVPLVFARSRATYQTQQGGWVTVNFWAIEYAPLVLMALAWPAMLCWGWAGAWIPLSVSEFEKWRQVRRAVRQSGLGELCPACGYDLRASADRCPECGTTFVRRTIIVPEVTPSKT